jgi:hypothetical protein
MTSIKIENNNGLLANPRVGTPPKALVPCLPMKSRALSLDHFQITLDLLAKQES